VPTSEISGTKVEDMKTQLERYHGEKRANQEYDDLFYDQNSEALAREWLPADIPIYKSSLSTDVVDQVSDQLRTDEPSLIYGALTNSDREMERKSKFEGWGKQIVLDDQEGADVDAYSQAGKDLGRRRCRRLLTGRQGSGSPWRGRHQASSQHQSPQGTNTEPVQGTR